MSGLYNNKSIYRGRVCVSGLCRGRRKECPVCISINLFTEDVDVFEDCVEDGEEDDLLQQLGNFQHLQLC